MPLLALNAPRKIGKAGIPLSASWEPGTSELQFVVDHHVRKLELIFVDIVVDPDYEGYFLILECQRRLPVNFPGKLQKVGWVL